MKIAANLSMRLERADRINIQIILTHVRKTGSKGRKATMADALRWAFSDTADCIRRDTEMLKKGCPGSRGDYDDDHNQTDNSAAVAHDAAMEGGGH